MKTNWEIIQIMQDEEIRKAFGRRLKELRKQKGWTQKELAEKLDIRFGQLNKYECGLNAPPLEKLVQIAEILNVTADYLLTGDNPDETPIHNTRLLERFRILQKFKKDDQEAVIKLIDAMIIKHRVENAVVSLE
jgi:transcriptional regulator with XRE-family HTH domain